MRNFIHKKLQSFKRDEGGAVFILVLAAFLILFMVGMTLFDTGVAAGDKMSAQISADATAYSHSVIKARSMNAIVYANIIKRTYFSFLSTHTTAMMAIAAHGAAATKKCKDSWFFSWACPEAAMMGLLLAAETLETLFTNGPTMGSVLWGTENFAEELLALDTYQRYMHAITPWWASVESILRGAQNGGVTAVVWPPPPTDADAIKDAVATVAEYVGMTDALASFSLNVDTLPIARRDKSGDPWTTVASVYDFDVEIGFVDGYDDHLSYCQSYIASFEHISHASKVLRDSTDSFFWRSWKSRFRSASMLPFAGCLMAHTMYANEGYLDWRIKDNFAENSGTKDAWAQASSNISFSYRPRQGRMDSDGARKKYDILSAPEHDYVRNDDFDVDGFFAMARSELVYKQPFEILATPAFGGGLSVLANRLGIQKTPDMWSPRWKGRLRPFLVPGETLGSAVQTTPARLDTIINDSIPLLLLGSIVIGDRFGDDFSTDSAKKDIKYLLRAGDTFTPEKLKGVPK